MSKQWYYLKGEEQKGPFSWVDLYQQAKNGFILPNDLVWADGMPQWIPASQVKSLMPEPITPPPPAMPSSSQTPPALPTGFGAASSTPTYGSPAAPPASSPAAGHYQPTAKKNKGLKIALIVILALFVLGGGGLYLLLSGIQKTLLSSDTYTQSIAALKASPQSIEFLGEPIETGRSIKGEINVSNGSGNSELSIPVSGPNAAGTLYAEGIREGGTWSLSSLILEGSGRRIDILDEATIKEAVVQIENGLEDYTIYYIYCYPTGGEPGEDYLSEIAVLMPGEKVEFVVAPGINYDIAIEDEDGDAYTRKNISIEEAGYRWTVTLADMDDIDIDDIDDIDDETNFFQYSVFNEASYDFTFNYPQHWSIELYNNEVAAKGLINDARAGLYVWKIDADEFTDLTEMIPFVQEQFENLGGEVDVYDIDNDYFGGERYDYFEGDGFWFHSDGTEYFEVTFCIDKKGSGFYMIGVYFNHEYGYDPDFGEIFWEVFDSFRFKKLI